MTDLTMASFAYLRLPLVVAGMAFADWRGGRVAKPVARSVWRRWRR